MVKENFSKISALIFGVLIILLMVSFYVLAWQEPAQFPPAENVPAPINVGPEAQVKKGSFTSEGDITAKRFCLAGECISQWKKPITFIKTFGGQYDDKGRSVLQLKNGEYIILGTTVLWWWGGSRFYLIETAQFGEKLSDKTLGCTLYSSGSSVATTSDGGYILVGKSEDEDSDVCIIKIDKNFNLVWYEELGANDRDEEARAVFPVESENYLVVGHEIGYSSSIYLIKINQNGIIHWQKKIREDWRGYQAYSGIKTSDGNYLIVGRVEPGARNRDLYLLKIDQNGEKIWSVTHDAKYREEGFSVVEDKGYYIVVGYTKEQFGVNSDVFVLKVNSQGVYQKRNYIGGSGAEVGHSIVKASDGGYLIAGFTSSMGAGKLDVYLVKIDENFNPLWEKTFGGSEDDLANFIYPTSDGGYIIVGNTKSFGRGGSDIYLIKTDSHGNVY